MKLRDWQAEAFPLWWNKKQGIIKVVTGGGKTFFAIHCIKEYIKAFPEKDILIVVPSIALLDQWNEALSENNLNQEIVLNGCLLYTSPSPRDISGSRMPSSA